MNHIFLPRVDSLGPLMHHGPTDLNWIIDPDPRHPKETRSNLPVLFSVKIFEIHTDCSVHVLWDSSRQREITFKNVTECVYTRTVF